MLDFQKYFKKEIDEIIDLNHNGNNQIFEIRIRDKKYILKFYSAGYTDNWKRGQSEFKAASYLWSRGFTEIPKPIAFFEESDIGIYSYEPGVILRSDEIKPEHIINAANFIAKLHNLGIEDKAMFGPARSACFSIKEYIDVLYSRFKGIFEFVSENTCYTHVKKFLKFSVYPAIQQFEHELSINRVDFLRELPLKSQVLTPADFGFHNILVSLKKYTFIDFEYFGRDDPVRQILDFLHHDRFVGVQKEMGSLFLEHYRKYAKPQESFEERLKLLDPIIGLTWVLIYLNVLSKNYIENIKSRHQNIEEIIKERIAKSEAKMNTLRYFGGER